MTGSDLCASTKPWKLQLDTVEDIYHEFYTQGDKEMASGRLPVPIMNRFHRDEQAVHQVMVVLCTQLFVVTNLHETVVVSVVFSCSFRVRLKSL